MIMLFKILKTSVIVLIALMIARYTIFGATIVMALGIYNEWKEQIDGKDI